MADRELFFDRLESARRSRKSALRASIGWVGFSMVVAVGLFGFSSNSAITSRDVKVAQAETKASDATVKLTAAESRIVSLKKDYEDRITKITAAAGTDRQTLLTTIDQLNKDKTDLQHQIDELKKTPPPTGDGGPIDWKGRFDELNAQYERLVNTRASDADLRQCQQDLRACRENARNGDTAKGIVIRLQQDRDAMAMLRRLRDSSHFENVSSFRE